MGMLLPDEMGKFGYSATEKVKKNSCYIQVMKCAIKVDNVVIQLSLNEYLRKHRVFKKIRYPVLETCLNITGDMFSWFKKTVLLSYFVTIAEHTNAHFLLRLFLLREQLSCCVMYGCWNAGCSVSFHSTFYLTLNLLNEHCLLFFLVNIKKKEERRRWLI